VTILDVEVMVLGIVGVEIGLRAVDGDLAQQADFARNCRLASGPVG
jgi:hypothetical protein